MSSEVVSRLIFERLYAIRASKQWSRFTITAMRLSTWMLWFGYVFMSLIVQKNYSIILIQLTNEFKFSIAAFHHAHETYLVPDLLKKAYGISLSV